MKFTIQGNEDRLMTDSAVIRRFLHGGKGVVYLVNAETEAAHKYSFEFPKRRSEFDDNTIFAYVHHEDRKMYLGKYVDGGIIITRSSRFGPHTEAFKGANYIAKMAVQQSLVDSRKMLLFHNGRCCKCGRPLKSPGSIDCGFGKKCLGITVEQEQKGLWDGNWSEEKPFLKGAEIPSEFDLVPDDHYNRTWKQLQDEYF